MGLRLQGQHYESSESKECEGHNDEDFFQIMKNETKKTGLKDSFILTYTFCLQHLDQNCRSTQNYKKEKRIVTCQCKKSKTEKHYCNICQCKKSNAHNSSKTTKCRYSYKLITHQQPLLPG